MKRKPKEPRTKDRSKTEQLLVTAAKKVFAEHGYAAATTRMIALESGVNLGLISRYFGNKHGLLLAVIENEVTSQRNEIAYPEQTTLTEECIEYSKHRFNRTIKDEALFRIILTETITDLEFQKKLKASTILRAESNAPDRLIKFLSEKDPQKAKFEALQIISFLDRAVLGTAAFQYLVGGDSKAKCLKDLEEGVRLFMKDRSA